METSRAKWVALLAALVIGTLTAMPGWAQSDTGTPAAAGPAAGSQSTGPQSSDQLQEVVVTARKRSEAVQNVPITEDVFTAQQIESAGIQSPRDFIAMVPNMTLVETQNIGNSFVTIRGISQARNSEPSVAVIVDGVLETNPYEFNQELYDVREIEVLKGPQGALYGRDAIGGAIIIRTEDPSSTFEGKARVGVGNGVSERAQAVVSGPLDSSGTLKYRASVNFYNTDGYLHNAYLDKNADPYRDYSGRYRLLWTPTDRFSADFRFSYDRAETTAYYFVIPRSDEAVPFTSLTAPPDANDTTTPIRVNNEGTDNRDILDAALKLDWSPGYGTITSITDYDQTKEIDTGDAFDFRPVKTSIVYNVFTAGIPADPANPNNSGPFDESQSQFIRVRAWSQELRFTSPTDAPLKWIAGAYFVHTERFVSTGNLVDRGFGVSPVYETPRLDPANPIANDTNATFLADGQNNNAWALFGDVTYDLTKQWELDAALRYDEDARENTTFTPTPFLPDPSAFFGEVRKHTWNAWQPKATVRYKPTDDWTVYADWSRGFRSGGFNQTGVAVVAAASNIKGVGDLFNAEIADTYELGIKGQMLDRRLSIDADVYHTHSRNGYFFVFLAANSTQNLGNLNATYKGAEIELTAHATDRLNFYAGYGYTDSKITAMADPTVLGNQAPLVSRDTINAGAQYRQPLADGLEATARLDYQNIGRTWWDPYDSTSRDPVNLVDLRLGLQGDKWSVTAWSKNLTNTIYNAEFSPGGFLWRALPRRYGVDFEYRF
ncbi:MAG TPA: TonB-dependent receptor [Steroidobacteraceae bacterium]|nr:TonB-dependent receptor [Steroidobacteraceae bacterium]